MLLHRSEFKTEEREKPRNGTGTAMFRYFVEGQGKVQKNINMLAEITLPQGASIGPHAHTDETEFYIILEGSGRVNDNGAEKAVTKGDVMMTGNGETHSIGNTGTTPLVFLAVIVKG
ncbi:MAG: cupin domain-containing protein [Treponema sp.]|jgi:mannose-6-phosphate isomerase-like protein (cupin superfamily)|nr:cupin domain-containing protein [Treponema sp.]